MVPANNTDDVETPSETLGGNQSGRRILYPIFGSHDTQTLEIALDIADGADAELLVMDLVDDPNVVDESRSVASDLLHTHLDPDHDVETRLLIQGKDTPVKTVIRVAESHDVDLVVFDQHTPASLTGLVRGDVQDRVSKNVSCDTVTVARWSREVRIGSILVPIAGGPHSDAAVVVAGAIARALGVPLELFHVAETNGSDEAQRIEDLFTSKSELLADDIDVETWHLERRDVAGGIVEQSRYYGLTALGEPQKSRLRRFVTGSITDEVSDRAESTVLVTQRGKGTGFRL